MERVKTILFIGIQIVANLGVLLESFLPFSASKIREMLKYNGDIAWETIGRIDLIAPGLQLDKPKLLFEQISDEEIQKQVDKLMEAERVPKTKKLLKLLIDTGIDKRTLVGGIAEQYKPEDIIGKKVTVLANLKPRKIRGIMSEGMLLMAENPIGDLAFLNPSKDVENGSCIG